MKKLLLLLLPLMVIGCKGYDARVEKYNNVSYQFNYDKNYFSVSNGVRVWNLLTLNVVECLIAKQDNEHIDNVFYPNQKLIVEYKENL